MSCRTLRYSLFGQAGKFQYLLVLQVDQYIILKFQMKKNFIVSNITVKTEKSQPAATYRNENLSTDAKVCSCYTTRILRKLSFLEENYITSLNIYKLINLLGDNH